MGVDENKSSLGHMPNGDRWVFDQSVTDVFEDMLQRSIPQYGVMRDAVYDVGSRFVQPHSCIVDLGCSRGDALAPFVDTFEHQNVYVGIDVSEPMLKVARKRFEKQISENILSLTQADLTGTYPAVKASLTLCVLTLQFIPVDLRAGILKSIYQSTLPGGALIMVEKVVGETEALDRLMTELYRKFKEGKGYSVDEIERKQQSLEGVLIPLSARNHLEMLTLAGFRQVDCFWRWMNFSGYVAVKG